METILWVEQYRPKDIASCILPKTLKSSLTNFIVEEQLPNLILSGSSGVGKTTAAKAMVEELGLTYMMINGSEESGFDVLRTKIKNFASTVSLHGGRKYIILDEADYLNPQSTQPALRGFMEEFHKNCGFILTCNYKNRLIQPLHSRCSVIDFAIPNSEKPNLANEFYRTANFLYPFGILTLSKVKNVDRKVAEKEFIISIDVLTNDYMNFMRKNGVTNQSFIKGTFVGDDLTFCNEIRSAIEITINESSNEK